MRNLLREWLGIADNAAGLALLCAKHDSEIADLKEQIANIIDPPVPPKLPFFIYDMRESHPSFSDAELCEKYWSVAQIDTHLFRDTGKKNSDGFRIFEPVRDIEAGKSVLIYRWAFKADGGSVRECLEYPKLVVNIRHFSKPE